MAAVAAVFLSVVACAVPGQNKTGNNTAITLPSPSASPSPSSTPAQAFAAAAPTFHEGEVGVGYPAVAMPASGGLQPYHWTLSGGALPPGLTLGGDGSLSGTPTKAGKFAFSIEITDSAEGKAPVTGAISIAPHVTLTLIPACARYCAVELGCADACGKFGNESGGVSPFVYTQASGQLPSGTTLNGLSLLGTFGGATGYLQFTVQVTDGLGGTATISPTFWMYPHISVAGGTIPASPNGNCPYPGYSALYGPDCRAQFPYSGGTPNSGTPSHSAVWVTYSWTSPSLTCTNPPPMPAIAVGNGLITVTVPQVTGCGSSGYTGTLAITLANQDLCAAGGVKCSASAKVTIRQTSG